MEFITLKKIFKQVFNLVALMSISFSSLANVMLVDGHVRAMPPSVPNSAAYFTLMNHGPSINLIGVEVAFANEAQLHTIVCKQSVVCILITIFSLDMNWDMGAVVTAPCGHTLNVPPCIVFIA